jgi:hypothetical protein
MKPGIGLIFLSISMLLPAAGCRKCETCKVYDSQGNELPDPKRTCGSRKMLEKAEENASLRAMNLGGTYTCEVD